MDTGKYILSIGDVDTGREWLSRDPHAIFDFNFLISSYPSVTDKFEPNTELADAHLLTESRFLDTMWLSAVDSVDYFEFEVQSKATVMTRVTDLSRNRSIGGNSSKTFTWTLLDSNLNGLTWGFDTSEEFLDSQGGFFSETLDSGKYYIQVQFWYNKFGTNGDVGILQSKATSPYILEHHINEFELDSFEENDSIASAVEVPLDSIFPIHLNQTNWDYFEIDATSNDTIWVHHKVDSMDYFSKEDNILYIQYWNVNEGKYLSEAIHHNETKPIVGGQVLVVGFRKYDFYYNYSSWHSIEFQTTDYIVGTDANNTTTLPVMNLKSHKIYDLSGKEVLSDETSSGVYLKVNQARQTQKLITH